MTVELQCFHCGTAYQAYRSGQKWCSRKCASRAWKAKDPETAAKKRKEWGIKNADKIREYERNALRAKEHLRSYRKNYGRVFALKKYFNITPEQYEELRQKQNYQCAICLTPETELKRSLSVDHCHDTGEIRGLLCTPCNKNLVNTRNTVSILQKAIEYIENFRTGLFVPDQYREGNPDK